MAHGLAAADAAAIPLVGAVVHHEDRVEVAGGGDEGADVGDFRRAEAVADAGDVGEPGGEGIEAGGGAGHGETIGALDRAVGKGVGLDCADVTDVVDAAIIPARDDAAAHETCKDIVGADGHAGRAPGGVVEPLVLDGLIHLQADGADMGRHQAGRDNFAKADVGERRGGPDAVNDVTVTGAVDVAGLGPAEADAEVEVFLDHLENRSAGVVNCFIVSARLTVSTELRQN